MIATKTPAAPPAAGVVADPPPVRVGRVAMANLLGVLGVPAFFSIAATLRAGPLDRDAVASLALTLAAYAAAVWLARFLWVRLLRADPAGPLPLHAARIGAWCEHAFARTGRWCAGRPVRTLWLAALAGVLLSCYPIVFLGKSFLGPAICGTLLYNRMPTLPGSTETRLEWANGADTAAGALQNLPYSAVEHRAIFHDGEFPLWNRFNSGGLPLLGQGQSMLADPLQWPLLLAGANDWAWNLKYLAAKLLFAAGIGLGVRAATGGKLFAAAVSAFGACFLGFFIFRFNHPAFFSECYAPWILYAWLGLAGEATGRPARSLARWLGLLLLADWAELGSGTVKEADFLLLILNTAGALALVLDGSLPWRARLGRLALGVWTGLCFVLLSAPLWLTFLDTLGRSWNAYIKPTALQLQPGLAAGLFDDIFYRQFNHSEKMVSPGASFLVLLGLGFAVAGWKSLARRGVCVALAVVAAGAAALVFGLVPPGLIVAVPFLGNVFHIDTTFSSVLIVPLLVLAGCGLQHAHDRLAARDWTFDAWSAVGVMGLLIALWCGTAQAMQNTDFHVPALASQAHFSPFFWGYVATLAAAYAALPFLWRRLCLDGGSSAPGVLPWVVFCLGALLWRQGLHDHAVAGPSLDVFFPPPRVDFHAPSTVVERIRALQAAQPGRAEGFDNNLTSGYGGMLGLELPSGPDALQNRYFHQLVTDSGLKMLYNWSLCTTRRSVTEQHRFYDMLNVRYYVGGAPPGAVAGPVPPGLRLVAHDDLDLFVSDSAWPRAFFTDSVAACDGDGELLGLLGESDGLPFVAVGAADLAARPALQALAARGAEGRAVVPATGYRLTNNTTTFHVHAAGPGVVALLEAFQPEDMRVSVNGQPAACFRVNEAFSGVTLERAGDYTVSFRYWPRRLTLALWMAAAGAGLLGLTWVTLRREA